LGDLLGPHGPPAGAALTDDVLRVAEQHQLLPALRSALAGDDADPALADLRAGHLRNLARNLALAAQANELLAAFDAAGIPAAPLKGVDTLLQEVYADWGARTMADIDVLVDPAAGDPASAVLTELGYEPSSEELPGHHHLTPMMAPGRVGVVEVHTGLQDRDTPAFIDAREVLGRAVPVDGRPGRRLDRTDAATHLVDHAQHAAARHRVVLDIRALHETALVIERVPDVDWAEVRDRFDRAGIVERFDAHVAASAALFGVVPPVPLGAAGRWVARRELFVDDHPLLGLADRPGLRATRLSRARMERYYGTSLAGRQIWRARARYLGEVGRHWRTVQAGRWRSARPAGPPPR
jgi:hypothetical protein